MINFKITSLLDGNLQLDMAQGKSVLLKPGEVVKAEVVSLEQSGDVVLNIKGELINARTEVALKPGDTAFFKVSDSPASANQLRLQFVGLEDSAQAAALPEDFMASAEGQVLASLIQELSDSLSTQDGTTAETTDQQGSAAVAAQPGETAAGTGGAGSADTFPLDKVESLLKALPSDINALPQGIKTQLQDLLLSSLKTTGQSIQTRLDTVVSQLPDALKNSLVAGNFKDAVGNLLDDIGNLAPDVMISADKPVAGLFKNALLNTGVALEAKLKSEVLANEADAISGENETGGSGGIPSAPQADMQQIMAAAGKLTAAPTDQAATNSGIKSDGQGNESTGQVKAVQEAPQDNSQNAVPSLQNDLKAVLLELKQRLAAAPEDVSAAAAKQTAHDTAALKNLQGTIEGLLKDVETFQALSKTTDSFYTFLPLNWNDLKDGEVSFKKGRSGASGGSSCSCRINLDLADSGSLSILILMHNKDFFVSFKAERPETHSAIDSNLDELKASFIQKGMSLKAAHMLDPTDTSMEKLDKLGSSERIISVKA